METTRIDTKKLTHAVEKASGLLDEILDVLGPYTVVLDEVQRATLLKPRDSFPAAAEAVLVDVKAPQFDEVRSFAGTDPAAIAEDLANVKVLTRLDGRIQRLIQRLADTRLLSLAEAYAPMLELYAAVKLKAKTDPELAVLVAPFAELFASNGKRKKSDG